MKKLCCRGIDVELFSVQLIFDNYTTGPHSSTTMPAASYPKRFSTADYTGGLSSAAQNEDLDELREELQAKKKQILVIMEQSRRSSDNEKRAIQQVQEAMVLKETAVAEATEATRRENHMLELMNDASLDMAGMLHKTWSYFSLTLLSCTPF